MTHGNVARSAPEDADSPVLISGGNRQMLIRPEYLDTISADTFVSSTWESLSQPVEHTGRGSAWFLKRDTEDWTLRYYQRGGLVAHFNSHAHLYMGQSLVRSFSEFHLLDRMYHLGLPVPKPVAASYHRIGGLWYRAQIIMEKIPAATPFLEHLLSDNPALWTDVGRLIRRFHDCGVYHADLNCHNILTTTDDLYLIDFDKSRFRNGEYWKQHNLKRLKRSIEKVFNGSDKAELNRRWAKLMGGYGTPTRGSGIPSVLPSLFSSIQAVQLITIIGAC